MCIRAYGSIHTHRTKLSIYILIHHCRNTKDLDSIIFTICINIYTHLQLIQGEYAMGMITGYFCSANQILAQMRVSFWWMAQRIVDYYIVLRARGQRLDSVLFSQSDNRHITTFVDTAKLIYSIIPATFHMLCMYMKWTTDDSWYR
jgi:hypothetical protein